MDNDIKYALAFIAILGLIIWSEVIAWNEAPKHTLTVQYDCRLAEISVDYPQQVKEKCRKLLMPEVK